MNRTRGMAGAALTLALLAGALPQALAVPVFARKYGFDCTMCHVQFPKLNDFGQRYRDNGYQLPGQERLDKDVIDSPPPVAMRTSAGFVSHNVTHVAGETDANEFGIGGLDLLSGGLFTRDIGFFAIYTPPLDPGRGSDSQTGRLEMANVVFNNLGRSSIDLRIGRFEPSFLGTSAKRSYTFTGYEVCEYEGATGGTHGGFSMSDMQEGVELTGHWKQGWNAALGWVNGSQNHGTDHFPSDVYARAWKVFGRGEGQTAGHRLGLMTYCGRARPGDADAGPQFGLSRIGADVSLCFDSTNVLAQWVLGHDDNGFTGGADGFNWHGGFLEVDHSIRPNLIGFARYDWVRPPSSNGHDIDAWVLGGRWYLEKNLAVHGEYASRHEAVPAAPDSGTQDLILRLDFAY